MINVTKTFLACIGNFGNQIGIGSNIMTGSFINSDILLKKRTLINLNCTIGHDSVLMEFTKISSGTKVSGNCFIGGYSALATNSTVLPKINIGKNIIIRAGAVITKDITDNCLIIGMPEKIVEELQPLEF
ncbi:hypothetical protein GON26_09010 [Flavobacterium sp. GA093]|uniref:Acyltransferase n=1 Tax=Flavobacterium hydrocarbonoxydans TaxID=2683249 RepID=A0A6I4NNG4_9FLAO|nr:hypothetical protein [Flavobacterium hydrocarbonoxydans]MWB94502.1 hypothetical protein [Flavobacterium hydrocarbonoxydans]